MKNIVRLNALKIEIPLDETIKYHDDGLVRSLEDSLRSLDLNYNFNRGEYPTNWDRGICVFFDDDNVVNYHIFYTHSNLHEFFNMMVRGHEETHFLDLVGKLDLLKMKIIEGYEKEIDFHEIEDREIIADIGGLYRLMNCGYNIDLIDSLNEKFPYMIGNSVFNARKIIKEA